MLKSLLNKSLYRIFFLFSLVILLEWNAAASISINLGAEVLKTGNGSLMPTTGLVVLVASTNGVFGGPTPTSFVSSNNVIMGSWDLSNNALPGYFFVTLNNYTIPAGLSAGNQLTLYWFPTLNISATAPGAGIPYGYYRDTTGVDGNDSWVIPNDSGTVDIYFITTDAASFGYDSGGTPATNGLASYTVDNPPVADPVTYTRTSNVALKINLADLRTKANWQDANTNDSISFAGISATSTNNIYLSTNSTDIFYTNAPAVNDQFTYTISDGHPGGLTTGTVNIQIVSATGTNSVVSLQVGVPGAGTNSIQFAGIPNYTYVTQYATNVGGPWLPFSTNTASTNGFWTAVDTHATNVARFYRAAY